MDLACRSQGAMDAKSSEKGDAGGGGGGCGGSCRLDGFGAR
jgi:hypothetical protein